MLTAPELIDHVSKAINPAFKNWVLFSNGTYIILEDSAIVDKPEKATEIMKTCGPVHAGSPAGDFTVIGLRHTDGWAVSGHYNGMYTYVHPTELSDRNTGHSFDVEVGLLGRQKREKDGLELKVIFVHG